MFRSALDSCHDGIHSVVLLNYTIRLVLMKGSFQARLQEREVGDRSNDEFDGMGKNGSRCLIV